MNEPAKQPLELPSATYEPQLSASIDLERCLSREVLLHVFDLSGTHEVKTCYGDVVKIVNALRDYPGDQGAASPGQRWRAHHHDAKPRSASAPLSGISL